MWTIDLIKELQEFVAKYGDKPVVFDNNDCYYDIKELRYSGKFCVIKIEE